MRISLLSFEYLSTIFFALKNALEYLFLLWIRSGVLYLLEAMKSYITSKLTKFVFQSTLVDIGHHFLDEFRTISL